MKKIYIKPTSEVVVINSEDIAEGLPVSQGATTTGDEAWTKQSSSWEDED